MSSYFEVLDSMQLLFPVELFLATARRDQLIAAVRLYKALGGGLPLDEAGRAALVEKLATGSEAAPEASGGKP